MASESAKGTVEKLKRPPNEMRGKTEAKPEAMWPH